MHAAVSPSPNPPRVARFDDETEHTAEPAHEDNVRHAMYARASSPAKT